MMVIYDKTYSNRQLVDVLLDGYDVSYLDVRAVCWDYGIALEFDEDVEGVYRETGLRIVRGISVPKDEILMELITYLRKLYDENYMLLSLTRSIVRHGAL